MVAKIGFVILVLISSGTLFLLDYYLKQDQEENTKQLHSFVQQTRNVAKAMTSAKEKFDMELMSDLAHCQENAVKSNRDYLGIILKVVPHKNGQTLPTDVLDEAAAMLINEKAECVVTYDSRINAGI